VTMHSSWDRDHGAQPGSRARLPTIVCKYIRCRRTRKGADPGPILERAQHCKESEVDAINVADGPRASARMSAQSLCVLLQNKVGVDTILHYTCRDRNLLGIQSDLLGAFALGLRNILAITGDPPKLGDYPDATAVYDVDSVGLIRIMDHLNHGCDLAGNLIGPALGIHIGCGTDPSKPDLEKEVRRLEEKIKTIDRLIAGQTGPVRLMDQISRQLPSEVWLTGLKEAGGRVTLQGYAFTDFAIAEYMTRLRRDAGLFTEVELSFSERAEVQKLPVKRFELTLKLKA